jgi:hypothetical protein
MRVSLLITSVLVVSVVLTPRTAHADVVSSCGNLDIAGNAHCTLETSGGCTAKCTPVSFQASCSAQLEVSCSGQCTASADVNCNTSCTGSCNASCQANPGTFDCSGSCRADCEGNCSGQCQSSANQSDCMAQCRGSCSGRCSVKCQGSPPSASCDAKCQASCSGSCTAKANLSCDVDCQSKGYAKCTADLQGGCQAQCRQPKGALFCDGQFVNTSNLDQCVSDLKALLKIDVQASASSSCEGGTCSGEAFTYVKSSCDVTDSGAGSSPLLPLLGLATVALTAARRRKPVP